MDADRLKAIDLFSSLSGDELERVAGLAGEVTIEEGEASLGPGEVVGEQGIVEHGLRNASAVATSPVRAVFLTADQVRSLRRDIPDLDQKLRSILEERGE